MLASAQSLHLFKPEDYNKDSLNKIYGKRKVFIPGLELASLIALSFYPELKDSRITFKLAKKESTAKTTFTFGSFFNTADKHFIIYINKQKGITGFMFNDLPFNGQIGAIGHELAHVADFNAKGFFGIVWWGISYLSEKKRISIEKATDRSEIKHGLGSQLYEFGSFINNSEFITDSYRSFRKKYYLNTEDVLDIMYNNTQKIP